MEGCYKSSGGAKWALFCKSGTFDENISPWLMDIEELIAQSGDATLLSYNYAEGVLTIEMQLYEDDKIVEYSLHTNTISADSYSLEKGQVYRTVRIEIKPIHLEVVNGYYVAPADFTQMMKDVRSGINLAYGSKVTSVQYLFSLVGYSRLLSCLLSDMNEIAIR